MQHFQYTLTTAGLAVAGSSSMPDDVRYFAARLLQLADAMEIIRADLPPRPYRVGERMMEAEQIAKGLSEDARECLDWVRPHSIIAPYRWGAGEIEKLGLVQRKGFWFDITPLGLAVRAAIERKPHDH